MPTKDLTAPPAPGAALRKTVFVPLRLSKNAAKPHGIISGYASVFNLKDLQGDIVPRGAFAVTLAEHKTKKRLPPMLWMHDPRRPCGSWLMMAEDAIGLRVRGQLALGTQLGREALALIKQGVVTGLSIGYRIRHSRFDANARARILQSIELDEVSLVTTPANPAAQVSSVKTGGRLCDNATGGDAQSVPGTHKTLPAFITQPVKYKPSQPRVPAGNSTGGQWTDDPTILLALGVGLFGSLLGSAASALRLLLPSEARTAVALAARGLSSRAQNPAIRRIAENLETWFGGPPRLIRNKAGDIIAERGNKKFRMDINNAGRNKDGNPEKPHANFEYRTSNKKWRPIVINGEHRFRFRED